MGRRWRRKREETGGHILGSRVGSCWSCGEQPGPFPSAALELAPSLAVVQQQSCLLGLGLMSPPSHLGNTGFGDGLVVPREVFPEWRQEVKARGEEPARLRCRQEGGPAGGKGWS